MDLQPVTPKDLATLPTLAVLRAHATTLQKVSCHLIPRSVQPASASRRIVSVATSRACKSEDTDGQ